MTLLPLDHQRRLKKKQDLKKKTNVLKNLKQLNQPNKSQELSIEPFSDNHMKDALQTVRKSEIGIDIDYARFNGTSLYTESVGKDSLEKTLEDLEQEVLDELEAAERKEKLKSKQTKEPEIEVVDRFDRETSALPKSSKEKNEDVSWTRICEQLDKPRLSSNRSKSFFGQLRESLQTKQNNTLLNLKRSSRI